MYKENILTFLTIVGAGKSKHHGTGVFPLSASQYGTELEGWKEHANRPRGSARLALDQPTFKVAHKSHKNKNSLLREEYQSLLKTPEPLQGNTSKPFRTEEQVSTWFDRDKSHSTHDSASSSKSGSDEEDWRHLSINAGHDPW